MKQLERMYFDTPIDEKVKAIKYCEEHGENLSEMLVPDMREPIPLGKRNLIHLISAQEFKDKHSNLF